MMKKIRKYIEIMRAMPPFKPQLRQANRDGLKGQTRRVINPQPIFTTGFWKGLHWADEDHFRKGAVEHCPYGKANDLVYMREPLKRIGEFAYYADDETVTPVKYFMTDNPIRWRWKKDTLSGMFMPKEAARSFYRYEFIRVERVQEISEEDAVSEGLIAGGGWVIKGNSPVGRYEILWNSINAKRGYGWDVNPWVWVLGYKPVIYTTPGNIDDFKFGKELNLLIFDDFLEAQDG